jgi:hypothetical protein
MSMCGRQREKKTERKPPLYIHHHHHHQHIIHCVDFDFFFYVLKFQFRASGVFAYCLFSSRLRFFRWLLLYVTENFTEIIKVIFMFSLNEERLF